MSINTRKLINISSGLSGAAHYRYLPFNGELGGSLQNYTICNRFPAPRSFDGFKISIVVGDSAVVKYTFALSTNPNDDGAALSWLPIKFSGSDTVTRSGSGELWSDIIPFDSSSSQSQYIFIRAFSATAGFGYIGSAPQKFTYFDNVCFGNYASAHGRSSGDKSTSGAIAVAYGDWPTMCAASAVFYGPNCFSISAVGDSLDSGWASGAGTTAPAFASTIKYAAKKLDELGYSAGFYNLATAGSVHYNSSTKILDQFTPGLRVDFMTIRAWSPNDPADAASFARCFGETEIAALALSAKGCTTLFVTPTPCSKTGQEELNRQACLARIRSGRVIGIPVDIDAAVVSVAGGNTIKSEYNAVAADGVHLNPLGYSVIGNVYAQKIKEYIDSRLNW